MSSLLSEIRQTITPGMDGKHGPLPPLLLALTFVTGLVDAFSYLRLGHVFVANMTGNVVFLGFALAGAPGFSIGASVTALGSFWFGAVLGGRLGATVGQHRGRLLHVATEVQSIFVATAVVLTALSAAPLTAAFRYPLVAVLGTAMGIQNAAARKLAVPDMTTTVLTQTITGTAADSSLAGGKGSGAGRRVIAVAAMLTGALVGAAFVIHVGIDYPLAIALAMLTIVAMTMRRFRASTSGWTHAQ